MTKYRPDVTKNAISRRTFYQIGMLAAVVLTTLPAYAQQPTAPVAPVKTPRKTVRLLTVGNSFSGDATRLLGKLATASGNTLVMHTVSIGGGTLAQHWEKAEKYERDPSDPAALYGSKRSLSDELRAESWDFVTIQQASVQSHNVATYRPYAANLAAYIKKRAPRATLLIHETWAYRADDSRFSPAKLMPPGEPETQNAMFTQLRASYETIAGELGARIIPVGDAFHRADMDAVWGFKPPVPAVNPKQMTYPALPDQTHSLHMGWQWKAAPAAKPAGGAPAVPSPSTPPLTLQRDGHHASVAGQYLGACVFYETLFGESAVGNTFVPPGLSPDYARFLQKTAHEAVVARLK